MHWPTEWLWVAVIVAMALLIFVSLVMSESSPRSKNRAGPAKLNTPMRVDTAPEGEDIARENWSKYEQEIASTSCTWSCRSQALACCATCCGLKGSRSDEST